MLAAVAVAFVLGALCSLAIAVFVWLHITPVAPRRRPDLSPYRPTRLPQALEDTLQEGVAVESCEWFNVITAFLFQELRDSKKMKSFVMEKVNKEFWELMFTKKEGRMIEQLTVRDYALGVSLPIFSQMVIQKIERSENGQELEEIIVSLDVDYDGGFCIGVDADLVFGRVAYVAIRVLKVKGHGQLQMTTKPFTHWTFAFYEDPELEVEVDSTFEGRTFPQLSSVIHSHLRRWVRQKHTLPARKTRFKPFFSKPQPQSQLQEIYVHNHNVTVGSLVVRVVKCSLLHHPLPARKTYCTVSISVLPFQPLTGVWRSHWPLHEFRLQTTSGQTVIGIRYRYVQLEGKGNTEKEEELVMISEVIQDSIAAHAGVKKGDVITRVNHVKVRSVAQVRKVISKSKQNSIVLLVSRPPKHVSETMLSRRPLQWDTATHNPGPDHSEEEEVEHVMSRYVQETSRDADSISLCDVTGERRREGGTTRRRRGRRSGSTEDLESSIRNETEFLSDNHTESPSSLDHPPQEVEEEEGEEEESVGQTKAAEVSNQPCWKERVRLEVGRKHSYLNVCVYDQLLEETADLLIGYVTIPLMDIALECLSTNRRHHSQRYVLVAPEPSKATANRAARQAEVGRREKKKDGKIEPFVGNILLQFKHSPWMRRREGGRRGHHTATHTSSSQDPATAETHNSSIQPHSGSDPPPIMHHFEPVEMEGTQKCDICSKRIWALKGRVQVCRVCGMQCHKKCVVYCCKTIICNPSATTVNVADLESTEEGGYAVYEDHHSLQQIGREEGGGGTEEGGRREEEGGGGDEGGVRVEGGGEEEELSEYKVNSFVRVESYDYDFVKVKKSEESEEESLQGTEEEEEEEEDEDEELYTPPSDSGSDVDGTEQVMAELGHMMYKHIPSSDRALAIQNKIAELLVEIDRAEKLVATASGQLELQHRRQLEALCLLLEQHQLALAQLQSSTEPTHP